MSDTPRTDEQEHFIDSDRGIIDSGLGRQLERELNEANAIIRQQQLLVEENLALKQRVKRLEKAGDLSLDFAFRGHHVFATAEWNRAKEAKP